MHVGEAKEEAKASARGPFGYLLSILECCVQDIDRAAKNMTLLENVITIAHV
jgi:hypothetical protein